MIDIPVILFGAGGVGRALIRQLISGRSVVANRNNFRFNVLGVADSKTWLWRSSGLTDDQLEQLVDAKKSGRPIGQERPEDSELLTSLASYMSEEYGKPSAVIVDVTAAGGMESTIDQALDMGCGIVLANKKPLAGPWNQAQRYFNHYRLRYESTVGGGQPVISTLRYLMDTNDAVMHIEGQMSGTLGYICGRMDDGIPFSLALMEARNKGFTEPDPRQDLGGLDVQRKLMILGRTAGWPLEEAHISVEQLYNPALAHLEVAEFMQAAVAMDPSLADRVSTARENGKVLRYGARVDAKGGSIGLEAVSADNPMANLKYISFRTDRYDDQPLMIGGRGAGVEMTAAGVLGDMIGLMRESTPSP